MRLFDFIPAVKKHNQAEELNKSAQETVSSAKKWMTRKKSHLQLTFEDYGKLKFLVLSEDISRFIATFEKIKNVDFSSDFNKDDVSKISFDKNDLIQLKKTSHAIQELAADGITAIGSGALTGMAVYGAVGMLASASTGTAISTLSGAAATNATLAWLGGGALAAGGGGMAAGAMVLGGVVAAPVLAVGYMVFNAKADKNLALAKTNKLKAKEYRQEISLAVAKIDAIVSRVEQMKSVLTELSELLRINTFKLERIIKTHGTEYSAFPEEAKKDTYNTVLLAQATKLMLDIQLLDDKGNITSDSEHYLIENKKFLDSIQ